MNVVIGTSLFGGGVTENTTYAKTILESKDSVSTYFQQVVEPFSLKNGPVQLTAVPLLSETYLLSEYPDMKNKRYSASKMVGMLEANTLALDRQQEMSGTFIVFLRYERDEEFLGLSSFTIDSRFFDYMFLDNDKGDFLRVSSHTIGRAKTVDAYNTFLEFWVTFGENEEERKEFFQGSESVSISVSDFGFEDQTINYPLPLSNMFLNIPKEIKEIQSSIRTSLKVTFDGTTIPIMTGQTFGTTIGEPQKPTRNGYPFGGWYKDKLYTTPWDFKKDIIFDDTTIYAKWVGYFEIGGIGPSGGYVFYENPNWETDGWRYLEAAPYGWYKGESDSSGAYTGEYDPSFQWGAYGYAVDPSAQATGIGTGASNTVNIVNYHDGLWQLYPEKGDFYKNPTEYFNKNDGKVAAKVCADYRGGGYNDWFLPSKDELNQMGLNLKSQGLGGFSDDYYWSSSDYTANSAWSQGFYYGYQYSYSRYYEFRVRPVRSF